MKSFKKVIKIIGKILLIFIVVLVASSIISSVSFTDKLFAEIYMLRFGTDTEYIGGRNRVERLFNVKKKI